MRLVKSLMVTLGVLLGSLPLAHADAVVTNCRDAEGPGGLLDAMNEGGRITFACDGVIRVRQAIYLERDVELDATGHQIILSGGGDSSIFFSDAPHFSLLHITIADATDTALFTRSHMLIEDSVFTDNVGGAIFSQGGLLTIEGSTFVRNTGGALFAQGGELHVSRSMFSSNRAGSGAAIFGQGADVQVSESVFSDNVADSQDYPLAFLDSSGSAGAIFQQAGHLAVNDSLFRRNRAGARGGLLSDYAAGGAIFAQGPVVISGSTFEQNRAGGAREPLEQQAAGGAIFAQDVVTVVNSTFIGNVAGGGGVLYDGASGGAIYAQWEVDLLNVTLSQNHAPGGTLAGEISAANSIIAAQDLGCGGPIEDRGHNIDAGHSCGFGSQSLSGVDPILGAYGFHGGSTPTVALGAGSPAIDAADRSTCPSTDQRGFARVGPCDIGAYEAGA